MKKVVGKSLVLGAIALGVLSLLGGGSVFSKVLSNFKSTPKKEAVTEDTKEEIDQKGTEIVLEAKAAETSLAEPIPEEPVKQVETRKEEEGQHLRKPEPQKRVQETKTELSKPEAKKQKPEETESQIPWKATEKVKHSDGKYALIFPRGERVEYDKYGIPLWSSWEGRLTETEEEKRWKDNYSSPLKGSGSGRDGTGKWCLTPAKNYEVEDVDDCPKGSKRLRNSANRFNTYSY